MAININHATNTITATSGTIGISSNTGFKNRIINGRFSVSQRGTAAQTVTAGNTVPTLNTGYFIDRWFTYCLGANVTIQSLTNTATVTGAASVTEIGIGQRIEALNSQDLAGSTVTLSFSTSNQTIGTLNLSVSYANTSDTFGPIGTPTKTSITTKSFTITSTLTSYSYSFAIPSAATTGIEILFTIGGMITGTWVLTNVQLEQGNAATSYDLRCYSTELQLCLRYFEIILLYLSGYNPNASGTNNYRSIVMSVAKRGSSSINASVTYTNCSITTVYGSTTSAFSLALTNTAAGAWSTTGTIYVGSEIP